MRCPGPAIVGRTSERGGSQVRHEAFGSAGALPQDTVERFVRSYEASPVNAAMENALTRVSVHDLAVNRSVVTGVDHTFSNLLDDWTVTNQKASGRCWMFAGLNLFRVGAMRKMSLKEFEFSQNYTLFWDKLERSNYFLEAMLETAQLPLDDRTVAFLLANPLGDGGQWNMFVNLVKKHGLVPKAFMPETQSSSSTGLMNGILVAKLREGARGIRDLVARGAATDEIRSAKSGVLEVIHRILCMHLGRPPRRFVWQWNDKDRAFHRDAECTPLEFAARYVDTPLDDYLCLVNDPRSTSPYDRTFTVRYLGNVVGGDMVRYLNVRIEAMKDIAMRMIQDGRPVWFGCDVSKHMDRSGGIWDRDLYEYERVYGSPFALESDKEMRLLYQHSAMNHAMLFTGVDVMEGKPRRWRVENSWGEENGRKGFYVMNDNWFDEHMFEIAAHKDYLSPELRKALEIEPIVLPPWDPMGSLARGERPR
jgi:bleomycin hydrolase